MCLPAAVDFPEIVLIDSIYKEHEYIVLYNDLGYRCGYVRIPPGHPWHGIDYQNVDASVHGGLTFSSPDKKCNKGGADDGWWIGFDCGHAFDAQDPELLALLPDNHPFKISRMIGLFNRGTIRTTEYVENECKRLIDQVIEAQGTPL